MSTFDMGATWPCDTGWVWEGVMAKIDEDALGSPRGIKEGQDSPRWVQTP